MTFDGAGQSNIQVLGRASRCRPSIPIADFDPGAAARVKARLACSSQKRASRRGGAWRSPVRVRLHAKVAHPPVGVRSDEFETRRHSVGLCFTYERQRDSETSLAPWVLNCCGTLRLRALTPASFLLGASQLEVPARLVTSQVVPPRSWLRSQSVTLQLPLLDAMQVLQGWRKNMSHLPKVLRTVTCDEVDV